MENKPVTDEEQVMQLKKTAIPIVLWGCGEVAEQVYTFLEKKNVIPTCVGVDENQGETNTFHGLPVMNFGEISGLYPEFHVILGHSYYRKGNDLRKRYSCIRDIVGLQDCFDWDESIEYDDFLAKENEFQDVYDRIDATSKQVMEEYLNARINHNAFLINHVEKNYFMNDVLHFNQEEIYVDASAYRGDTIRMFLEAVNGIYRYIYAIEPEKTNYKILQEVTKKSDLTHITYFNKGCWNKKDRLHLSGLGTGKSGHMEKGVNLKDDMVDVDTLDHILGNLPVSLISFGVQDGCIEMLQGAYQTISAYRPKMTIQIGGRAEQILKVPRLLWEINPEYKVHFRFCQGGLPVRLTCIAV